LPFHARRRAAAAAWNGGPPWHGSRPARKAWVPPGRCGPRCGSAGCRVPRPTTRTGRTLAPNWHKRTVAAGTPRCPNEPHAPAHGICTSYYKLSHLACY